MSKTKEEHQAELERLIIEYREKHRPMKLMHLGYKDSKQTQRGAFYMCMLLLISFAIPSLSIGITWHNAIGIFLLAFFGSLHFYEGWITEETVNAWVTD